MNAYIAVTVLNCAYFAKNRVRLRKRTNNFMLFRAHEPLFHVGIEIMGPLTKLSKGNRFLLEIVDRFNKLTQAIPLRRIDALTVASNLPRIGY